MNIKRFHIGRLHFHYLPGHITWFWSLRRPMYEMDGVSWWLHLGPLLVSWRKRV